MFQMEFERASTLLEEAAALQRQIADEESLVRTLPGLGLLLISQHDYERAMALYEESLPLARRVGDELGIVFSLGLGALAFLGRGDDHQGVRELCAEGIELSQQLQHTNTIAFNLNILGALAASQDQPGRAARLWGAAEALREAISVPPYPAERHHYAPYIAAARAQLDEAAWEAAWAQGRAMSQEEAVEYALTEEEEEQTSAATAVPEDQAASRGTDALTRREREVARLVAQGLSNRRIAQELSISEHTAITHVRNILKKLGLGSRTQIAAWATDKQPLF